MLFSFGEPDYLRFIFCIEAFFVKEFAAKEKLEIVGPTFVETKTAKEPEEKYRLEPYLILRKENF